jgi:hypothetical protein
MSDNPHYVTPEQARKKDCCMKVGRYFCKGTDCMAWRWKETADWKEGSDLRVVYSKTHGYCGMVRQ